MKTSFWSSAVYGHWFLTVWVLGGIALVTLVAETGLDRWTAKAPNEDSSGHIKNSLLTADETRRFDGALTRAGENRREIFRAFAALGEPERRSAMIMVSKLEDVDLRQISCDCICEVINTAWKARRKFSWCKRAPLELFETYTTSPRILEEPLSAYHKVFYDRLKRRVKYCDTTAEASDVVWRYRTNFTYWSETDQRPQAAPFETLAFGKGGCQELVVLYIALARSVGLIARPAQTVWPTLGTGHYWAEVWDTESNNWHAVDCSSMDRPYNFPWVLRVPKAVIHSATGEPGGCSARKEHRWEAFTNTVGLFYPSGRVSVRVLPNTDAVSHQRVYVQVWLRGEMISLTSGILSPNSEVSFTLGQSARKPYRLTLGEEGATDWEWVAVEAGHTYLLTLNPARTKPFDSAALPPPLPFPEWDNAQR